MINNMVGPSNGVLKEDVLSIKEALMAAKLYKPDPKIGLHEWTDEDMFEGIKQLQRFIGDYPLQQSAQTSYQSGRELFRDQERRVICYWAAAIRRRLFSWRDSCGWFCSFC
jgi:hypothetical protein